MIKQPNFSANPGLSIIIVNYNAPGQVSKCIESISASLKNINFEIIIVDNNSHSQPSLKNNNSLKLIELTSNLGFAKANNIGVKNSDSEFLCFLNPDTIIIEDFITPLVNFVQSGNNIGACAPMLMYEDRSYQASTGFKMGFVYEFLEAYMLMGIYRKIKQKKYEGLQALKKTVSVGWVSGACFVIKKSVFESVNGFTEDYFLNYEDIDLCGKLEGAGYSNYYFPYLQCIHLDHKSFDKNYELLVYSRYKSRLIYAALNYNFLTGILVRLMHLNGLFIRLILVSFMYSGNEKISRKRGYFAALKLYLGLKSLQIP